MSELLIKGGRIVDPANKYEKTGNVLIRDGRIAGVGKVNSKKAKVIDARGKIVTPGLIDMHVHLREPGREEQETIKSGSQAAIASGFTSVACMPNVEPAVDNEASAEFVFLQAERAKGANIFPVGAITKERAGKELAEMGQLHRAGAVAFTDDGSPVKNSEVMRRGMEYSKMLKRAIISHCEVPELSGKGVMNEGYYSTVLGLPGIPSESEEIMIYRDISLAKLTGCQLHIAHVSTAGGVEIIKQAKKKKINVTAETAPHYFLLSDELIQDFNTNFKMNPPLRTKKDVQAIIKGLKDGSIDVIASDHAPHLAEEKDLEFLVAPFGIIGMESMLPLILTHLVHAKHLSMMDAISKITCNPAKILNLENRGALTKDFTADVTIIDPNTKWKIDVDKFKSKSRNCPFNGWEVTGRAENVIVNGKLHKCI